MTVQLLHGDCVEMMRTLPDQTVHCCVTSPPYFGLRDYGVDGQIGLEETPEAYIARLVQVFQEVRRVLRDDGTLWLNIGDTYCTIPHGPRKRNSIDPKLPQREAAGQSNRQALPGLKHKDLIGIPWMLAFALRADGWCLRQDIIWHKPNPMPESVTDRCTKAHEYLFLLSKGPRYYFDAEAMREPATGTNRWAVAGAAVPGKPLQSRSRAAVPPRHAKCGSTQDALDDAGRNGMRNRRSVWTVATRPYKEAHFATFPPALIEPCVLAGCPIGGTVLDPFGGSGTSGAVAAAHGRHAVLCELNPDYIALARERVAAAEREAALPRTLNLFTEAVA